jgi:acyl CoA:acetate/3-ketoacid CoA transferase beta subunit
LKIPHQLHPATDFAVGIVNIIITDLGVMEVSRPAEAFLSW